MEIKEIKVLRKELETKICTLINNFEEDTQVTVTCIYLKRNGNLGATYGLLRGVGTEIALE